jgi:hypothetical protein
VGGSVIGNEKCACHQFTKGRRLTVTTKINQISLHSMMFLIIDEQDLGNMIEGMVDRLLGKISANLANIAIRI